MATYVCSLPNTKRAGRIPELISDDPVAIERFAKKWDQPGRGVFECVSPLREAARRRALVTVAALVLVHVDVDVQKLTNSREEVLAKLQQLPLRLEIRDSGGGFHVVARLKEPVPAKTPEYARLNKLRSRLTRILCGDPLPDHAAALLRRVGTHNSKYEGEPRLVQVLQEAEPVDSIDLEELVELLGNVRLFTPLPKSNGHDHTETTRPTIDAEYKPPVDIEQRLNAMTFQGSGDSAIHLTQLQVSASMLRAGQGVDTAVTEVIAATRQAVACDPAAASWDWRSEQLKVERMCFDFIGKNPELAILLPDKLQVPFKNAQAVGKTPKIVHASRIGWHVRSWDNKTASDTHMEEPAKNGTEADNRNSPRKFRFKLVSFADLRPGLEPLYLVDELIPVAGLVDVWGKAKCYKSFWCLDLMLHVAKGWEYRDRYVRQGAVVYCAFEGAHGYKKRVEALRRHYAIEDGTAVPLYIMPGQANLIAEHRTLIAEIAEQLGDVKPAAVVLDTLNKSLFGSENKDVDMGAYVRAAEAIRDIFGCVVIIVHHCGYDDTRPRGHSSLPGAVDAQLAVTRTEEVITVTVEMMRDGPEDTQVISAAEVIDVGQDQNGKTLTSLVIVPSGASPPAEHRGWPRSLAVFYAALKSALASHGQAFQPEAGVLPVRAVDQWVVRDRFYDTYAEAEEDEKKRQTKIQKAFVRAVGEAQSRGVAKMRRTDKGQTMIWLPARGEMP